MAKIRMVIKQTRKEQFMDEQGNITEFDNYNNIIIECSDWEQVITLANNIVDSVDAIEIKVSKEGE